MDLDADAVICDFAETYRIYDLYQYPCEYIATLAAGLRDNSRIKTKQKGLRVTPELFALSICADNLGRLRWFQTKDGRNGVNPPASVLELLSGEKTKKTERHYRSGDDFRREWDRLARKGE